MNNHWPFNNQYLPHVVIAACIGWMIVGFSSYLNPLFPKWAYLLAGIMFAVAAAVLVLARERLELGESYRAAALLSVMTCMMMFTLGVK